MSFNPSVSRPPYGVSKPERRLHSKQKRYKVDDYSSKIERILALLEEKATQTTEIMARLERIETTIRDPEAQQKCPLCHSHFTRSDNLVKHLKGAHHAKDTARKCHICGRDFSRSQDLSRHLKRSHGNEPLSLDFDTWDTFTADPFVNDPADSLGTYDLA